MKCFISIHKIKYNNAQKTKFKIKSSSVIYRAMYINIVCIKIKIVVTSDKNIKYNIFTDKLVSRQFLGLVWLTIMLNLTYFAG